MYIKLHYNDQVVELLPNKFSSFEAFYVDFTVVDNNKSTGKRIQFTIHPKEDFTLHRVELIFSATSPNTAASFFSNAFQSGLENRKYSLSEKMPKANTKIEGLSNDGFHSWTYAFLESNDQAEFIGSLNEWTGFNLILFEKSTSEWIVRKDLSNIELKHSFPIFDLIWLVDSVQNAFASYFSLMNTIKKEHSTTLCWIPKNLSTFKTQFPKQIEASSAHNINFDSILLDKDYCSHWGDWLSPKVKLSEIVQLAHQQNLKIGISIAPFVCEAASEIYRNKSNWILKNEPVKSNTTNKKLFALDILNKEVQDTLTGLFYKIFNQWNFDFVKLDLLQAGCTSARNNRTTGQLYNDTIRFLKETIGTHSIIASDLPIGVAFGNVDYLEVNPFHPPKWKKTWLENIIPNKVTTITNALRSTIGNWQLNGSNFSNIGIPFSLEETNQLSDNQQYTILLINTLMTNLLISSDDFSQYSNEQWGDLQDVFQWQNSHILSVNQLDTNKYNIHFTKNNLSYQALINLGKKSSLFKIGKQSMELEAFESIVLQL